MSGRVCNSAVGLVVGVMLLAGAVTGAASGSGEGLPAGALEELEQLVVGEMASAQIPGLAYVVVVDDQVVDAKAFGDRRLHGEPVTTETAFEIGSTTKAFTATMVAMLVEEGTLAWDDRVVDHLPEFRMHDEWVTREMRVADLLCQRSGMPPYALDSMSLLGFTRQDIIRALRFIAPVSSFRSTFGYQNNLWLVAAALIEAKTGLSWEDNLDRRIFGPLGMASTTTNPEVVATMPNVATGHFWQDQHTLVPIPADWRYRANLDTYGPAGSIRSNVLDLAKWVRFQINLGLVDGTRHLGAASVACLHAPKTLAGQSPQGDVAAYASGWWFQTRQRRPYVWHEGGTSGMHSVVACLPEVGVGLAMLTNEPDNKVPEHAVTELVDLVYGFEPSLPATRARREATGPAGHPAGVAAMGPPLPLERYVGTYSSPAYGPFEVSLVAGHLEMVLGPARVVMVLQPVSGNTFTMPWPDFPGLESTVTFTVHPGRPAEAMTVSKFEDVNGGVFVRAAGGAGHADPRDERRGR